MSDAGLPEMNSLYAIPKRNPSLREFVRYISLNCFNHTLTLHIGETPDFAAFEWIHDLDAMSKNPFPLEEDSITLEFNDPLQHPVGTLVLKGLLLVNHECSGMVIVGDKMHRPVCHKVVVQYSKLEIVKKSD